MRGESSRGRAISLGGAFGKWARAAFRDVRFGKIVAGTGRKAGAMGARGYRHRKKDVSGLEHCRNVAGFWDNGAGRSARAHSAELIGIG
jgi:hypothetical protein